MAVSRHVGQWAYGSLFVLVLPVLLVAWAWRLDESATGFWPVPFGPRVGISLVLIGIVVMMQSMIVLWRRGGGLPMNAYPPERFVDVGPYALLPHPIYAGFVAVVAGVAIAANSPAGLWVVLPIMALSMIALVLGYEGPRLYERFPQTSQFAPMFGLPLVTESALPMHRRVAAGFVGLVPWSIAYSVLSLMPEPLGAVDLRMRWEAGLPVVDWTWWIYSFAYPVVSLSPLLLRTGAEARRFVIAAWLVTSIGIAAMLLFPGKAGVLAMPSTGRLEWLVTMNRKLDAEWLALPSFHAVWIVMAAFCIRSRWPSYAWAGYLLAAAVCVSCISTGSHAVVDVVVGVLVGVAGWYYRQCWVWLVRKTEVLANSWKAVRFGSVRVISHSLWSALAATTGILVVLSLEGVSRATDAALVFTAGLLAAGIWGYWLEGGGRLSRPFGYYGFLFGAMAMLAILSAADFESASRLATAFALGAPLAQGIGRLRCVIQGCCHGRPVTVAPGIRVVNPYSRVTALGRLQGVPIHPTQLYSIVTNVLIFLILWRLWRTEAVSTLICGTYLILSSLARFVEEQYRGEPQTPKRAGLAIYHWLAIAVFVAGIIVSMVPGQRVSGHFALDGTAILVAIAGGFIAALAMSVDLPESNARFSRLTVGPPS